MKLTRIFVLGSLFTLAFQAHAESGVTTYIIQTQEKRESTRWTLTEWMRIKERMKLMDVWLAMNSDTKNDKFTPELNLSYENRSGQFTQTGMSEKKSLQTQEGSAQLFLTNIVSSTVGVRILNIDLGFDGGMEQSQQIAVQNEPAAQNKTYHYAADFRLFGQHIQDTSLVLRVGKYHSSHLISQGLLNNEYEREGLLLGGSLRLYFTPWLGVEGSYTAYGTNSSLKTNAAHSGKYFDYKGFIEIAIFRISAGAYEETWAYQPSNLTPARSADRGYMVGISLLL